GWIVFLDADERLDAEDGKALRAFLESDAIPGCAYGFQLYRSWGDELCVPEPTYVYRLFAFAPGQELPSQQLQLNPVPTGLPSGPTLACLLPARNCEDEIAGYLDSVARIADAVIALDDGSTDGTAGALERSALVKLVLRNPVREGWAGWDDAANRSRLLEAARDLG